MSEQQFLNLLQDVIDNGVRKNIYGHDDKYIISRFGGLVRFNLSDGFPLLTTKRTFYKSAFNEMLWFIDGSNDVVKLHNVKCTIWDEWGAKQYWRNKGVKLTADNTVELTKQWQQLVDDGVITSEIIPLHYSNSTSWEYTHYWSTQIDSEYRYSTLDQTRFVIDGIKKTPDRKSFLVSYWNPTTVYSMAYKCGNESVILPACHTHYSVNVSNGKLSIMLYLRSWDLFLGGAYNIAQYALLLSMYAKCTGYEPGELVIATADHHIYSDHVEQVNEQLTRVPYTLPTLTIRDRGQRYLQDFVIDDFVINDYQHHPTLRGDITVVGGY
jgi:thymidylate synthase